MKETVTSIIARKTVKIFSVSLFVLYIIWQFCPPPIGRKNENMRYNGSFYYYNNYFSQDVMSRHYISVEVFIR